MGFGCIFTLWCSVIYKLSCRWQHGAQSSIWSEAKKKKNPYGMWRNLFLITLNVQCRMRVWISEQVCEDKCWFAWLARGLWSVRLLVRDRSGAVGLNRAVKQCLCVPSLGPWDVFSWLQLLNTHTQQVDQTVCWQVGTVLRHWCIRKCFMDLICLYIPSFSCSCSFLLLQS